VELPPDPAVPLDDEDDLADCLVPPVYQPCWSAELTPEAADLNWLWHGYLAPGNITLLTSQAKSGKSTLSAVLLAQRAAGGTLAGRALKPGRTAVVCEEDEPHWRMRRRTLDFGNSTAFFCRPFDGRKPDRNNWTDLLDSIAYLHATHGVDLVIIDPLARFLPVGCENSGDRMLTVLLDLNCLLRRRLAVLLVHHPSKWVAAEGTWARGHGALVGHVDINLEMGFYRPNATDDRRRVLRGFSRYPETPPRLVLEWNAAGTDYLSRGDLPDEDFRENWLLLLPFFQSAPSKLTCRQVRACLPRGRGSPCEATLWHWLSRAVKQGLLLREGQGHCNSPFLYWLPAREAEWMKDPIYRLRKADAEVHAELERLRYVPLNPPPRPGRGRKTRKGESAGGEG